MDTGDIKRLTAAVAAGGAVFFGGAGVSTESGIPDFRSADGIYQQTGEYSASPEEILSHRFFERHTKEFFDYYRHHLVFPDAQPNKAHLALAEMERRGLLDAVITQNVDGLHQAAGSRAVLELHGSTHRNTCMQCGKQYGLEFVLAAEGVPTCACGGVVKPDVILYGEMLDDAVTTAAVAKIQSARTLIIGGTSLAVYPAAAYVTYFRGRTLVLINRDATAYDSNADILLRGKIGEILSQVCGGLAVPE